MLWARGSEYEKKKTVGRLIIFMHQHWTYLPPRDLYDVISMEYKTGTLRLYV